jgi:hypothetical protein
MTRPADVRRAVVRELSTTSAGERVAVLELRHADHRADRWWSWCRLPVKAPVEAGPLELGDEVEVVLKSAADASRVADGPGHYSCRLHPASEGPALPPDRSTDAVYGGLIERSEPPASGELILHLGSGVTCYPQLLGEGPFPPDSLRHGEWSEFILQEPHAVAHLVRIARGR